MASLPTIEMIRPGKGRVIVNEQDRDHYLELGWKLAAEGEADEPGLSAAGAGDSSAPADEPEGRRAALAVLSRADLVEAAKDHDITGAGRLNKADLIDAILAAEGEVDESDEDPPDDEKPDPEE